MGKYMVLSYSFFPPGVTSLHSVVVMGPQTGK